MSHQGGLVLPLVSFLWGRVVTPLYDYFYYYFPWLPVVGLSLQLSSSYAFNRPLFKQSSPLSCGVPRFLEPSGFFVSDIFGNISYFILTIMSSPFHPALNYSANYTSLVPTSSLRYIILLLSTLLTPVILLIQLFSRKPMVYVVAVRTELKSAIRIVLELTSPLHDFSVGVTI